MSSTTSVETPGDAELISAVRGGDTDAYGLLFERHVDAARRLARQLVSAGDVEDLVSEAFVKVLKVLQRGGGPDVAFRAYLLTAVRRLRVDRLRQASRLHTTDDMELFDPGVPFRDTAVEGFENQAAARAFASLPERWQLVLWHTEVEGQKPADVAPLLGMSANSVSALAYRAREGLRQAFLTEHAAELDDASCQWTRGHLGAYIRNGISRRDCGKVEDHLGGCRACAALYLELSEVNSNLSGILAPLLLGGVGAAYVSATTGAAAPVGLLGLVDRTRDLVAANSSAAAVVGVTAAATLGGIAFLVVQDSSPPVAVSGPVAGAGSEDRSAGGPSALPGGAGREDRPTGSRRRTDAVTVLSEAAAGPFLDATTPSLPPPPEAVPSPGPTGSLPTEVPAPAGSPTAPAAAATPAAAPTAGPAGTSATASPSPDQAAAPPPAQPSGTAGPSAPGPGTGSTAPPGPTATSTPTPAPTPRDLVMAVQRPVGDGVSVDISAAVLGIPAGESATVVITGDMALVQENDGPGGDRCGPWVAGSMTCTVGGAAPFSLHAVAANRTPALTFTVASDDGPESDLADNTVVVTWR